MVPEETNTERQIYHCEKLSCRLKGNTLFISGELDVDTAGGFVRTVIPVILSLKLPEIVFNLARLEDIDSAGVIALFHINNNLPAKPDTIFIQEGNPVVRKKIELFRPDNFMEKTVPEKHGLSETAGRYAYEFVSVYIYGFITLAANVFFWSAADLFKTKTRKEGEFVNQSVRIGVNASLIIIVMSFAIGLVLAIHSAGQLRTFGANIYIVDLIVIAMMSQMGPLITAILVAGRSGSAIAAEIATMKVTSELDALKTMGLDPVRFIIVPKLYACLLTMPFLILLSNLSGIAGGAVAAFHSLDITPEIFINRMGNVLQNKDLITGFVKSQVYAGIIVLTGSFYGFRVERGAEGVGKVTTTAVVVAISLVILADSILGLLFY